jgi:DNA polymerase I-like protein with 3'-5' exonuclease and polymerase domains
MFIPVEVNSLSIAEAFTFYRDKLRWQVYPVDPPSSKKQSPGKKPSVTNWWEYDAYDCDVPKIFENNGHCHNIGFAPRNAIVVVDLDSKSDQGKSVRQFLDEHHELQNSPRHSTCNGAHLMFRCQDLPRWKDPRGKPLHDTLKNHISDTVNAELYHSDHNNIILPPSVHVFGVVYRWETFGEIPEVSWRWLQDTFGFTAPSQQDKEPRKGKDTPWHLVFNGDLRFLNLLGLLEALGHPANLINEDDGKYAILCPWSAEHTTAPENPAGSSTVIWQREAGSYWPQFKCLHAHCNGRGLQDLLLWAENKEPGAVDRFCSQSRVWAPGQTDEKGRPRILHPYGQLDSEVHTELGTIIGAKHGWFIRGDALVTLKNVPSGFVYSENPDIRYSVKSYTVGLDELNGVKARSSLEHYVVPGVLVTDEMGNKEFIKKSFSTDFCASMVHSGHLRIKLPHIARILTVALPFRVGNKLIYPKPGYDPRFATYLIDNAPTIKEMSLQDALDILDHIHKEFCFTTQQSRTHAIARLLTPFARALIGWTTRTPLWFYCANRPRAGKDYLSGVPLIVYEGAAFEDQPIGKESAETAKRIMAAARSARRFMHFSNCQHYLQDQYLTQAITNPVINGRSLGSNDASSDLSASNEMEFSLSANIGLTYHEDLEPRLRKIELAYFEEDPNARIFQNKFLHRSISENRARVLSAIAAIYRNWAAQGFPLSTTPFISYPEWAEIIGGVMLAADLGDPCLPFKGAYDVGGDLKTEAMSELFKVCYQEFKDSWVQKKKIYSCVHKNALDGKDCEDGKDSEDRKDSEGNEPLRWFGPLEGTDDARSNQTKLGLLLRTFKNCVLGGIRLSIDESTAKSQQHRYRFTRADGDNPHPTGSMPGKTAEKEPDCSNMSKMSHYAGPLLALDIETFADVGRSKTGRPLRALGALSPYTGDIRLISTADSTGNITLLDLKITPMPQELLNAFGNAELLIHNAAFELKFLGVKFGIIPGRVFCTLTADRLLSPSRTVRHDLGSVLERHLGIQIPKTLGASDWGGMFLTDEQLAYATNDVRYLHGLREKLSKALAESKLLGVFELETALLPIIAAMEIHGFPVDTDRMLELRARAGANAAVLASELRNAFNDQKLNPASPQELTNAFKSEGVELADTKEETLCALEDPRAKKILSWRAETKLSSGIKTLLDAEHGGRIRAVFNPLGTVTGRFSSRHPNLQNITRGELRSCFIPSGPHRRLIIADYSQIELRVAALLARETIMIDAFKRREDLHTAIAAINLRKDRKAVTKEERSAGKAVNFGFLYGQSAKGFQIYARTSYGLTITQNQAERFRDNFFARYPAIHRWHTECRRKAQSPENNSARTILGRLLLAQKDDPWARFNLHTEYIVSGSCADLIKLSMVKLNSLLPADVLLVATVHDELVLDAPADAAEQTSILVKNAMVDAFLEMFGDAVPVQVDAKVCSNWAEK